MKHFILSLALAAAANVLACTTGLAQSPKNDPLGKAEALLKQSKALSMGGLAVEALKKATPDLAGSTWLVKSSDGQNDRWQFGNGTLNYQNLKIAADRGTGSWSIAGERVTIRSGAATWQGTLSGNRMQGSASNPSQTIKWNWTAERQ